MRPNSYPTITLQQLEHMLKVKSWLTLSLSMKPSKDWQRLNSSGEVVEPNEYLKVNKFYPRTFGKFTIEFVNVLSGNISHTIQSDTHIELVEELSRSTTTGFILICLEIRGQEYPEVYMIPSTGEVKK